MSSRYSFFFVGLVLLISSCTGLSNIPKDKHLFTGSEIVWNKKEGKIPKQKRIEEEVNEVLTPNSNTKFLWMRPRLAIHNMAGEPKKDKGFKHWLKYKVGEAPVFVENINKERVRQLVLNRLFVNGHFEAQVEAEAKTKKKTAQLVYRATITQPYKYASIDFPEEPDPLGNVLSRGYKETLLKKNEPYHLTELEEERQRLNAYVKDKGYFYFDDSYLIYKADSSIGNRRINLYIRVKETMPDVARKPYRIRNVYLFPNYNLSMDTMQNLVHLPKIGRLEGDSTFYCMLDGCTFRPNILARSIFVEPDSLYSAKKHEQTLKHLMGLGALQFADIRYKALDSAGNNGYLDAYIQLVPAKRKALRAEFDLVSKSNNFAGPGLNISYRNKNAFKGAELLIVRLDGRFETQIGGRTSTQNEQIPNRNNGLYSYEVGAGLEIYVPRFVSPIRLPSLAQRYVPKTMYQGEVRLLNRVNYFKMLSASAQFGYEWQETQTKTHRFAPVSIIYTNLLDSTRQFNEVIGNNPLLQRSFQNQFILGGNYSFTYQSAAAFSDKDRTNKNHIFFNGSIDIGGNLVYGIQSLFSSNPPTENEPFTLFSTPYAQYSRIETDFRYYFNINTYNHHKIATRLIAGIGVPYGNASVLPYTKQFFVGGPNSIRAFQARSVGPGSYITKDNTSGLFFDQTGEMRLEANIEYRFPIYSVLKGALFADAGNIWLINDDPLRPGGAFRKGNIINDIAVGVGAGLRIDVEFFVLRLDAAFPLAKPWLPENERWVAKDVRIGNRDWRRDNLVLNIAIGYPF